MFFRKRPEYPDPIKEALDYADQIDILLEEARRANKSIRVSLSQSGQNAIQSLVDRNKGE